MGEGVTRDDLAALLSGAFRVPAPDVAADVALTEVDATVARKTDILTHPVFRRHHSETQMLRYLKALENRDLALNHSMISLGSTTPKRKCFAISKPSKIAISPSITP